MPRDRRPQDDEQQPTAVPNAVIAAATQVSNRKPPKAVQTQAWQSAAWLWYDTIGEFRFAVNWVGNLLSQAKLFVAKDGKPTTDAAAVEGLSLLYGGPEGQAQMLRQMGIHYTVAGECYLVGEDGGTEVDDRWWVVAAVEIRQSGGIWKIGKRELSDPLVVRTWKPHPRKWKDSDSPTRAVLNILAEIEGLTKHVAAQIDSRLAGAGMLLVPSELSFASGPVKNQDGTTGQMSAATFAQRLEEIMMLAIENRESAAALVPIIMQAKGDELEKVRHLTFNTELNTQAIQLRTEAIRRLALGMDMPPEVLTGTGDMNHWSAWSMEEASIKAHTEPLLELITGDLTNGWLRPFLEAAGVEDPEAYTIEADTTALRLRPNRSKEALELYDRGLLGKDATVRENGFEIGDVMSDEERLLQLTAKLAQNTPTPEAAVEAARLLGIDLPAPLPSGENGGEGRELTPSLDEHPTREIPASADASLAAAVATAEMMVYRALERAGNRMKTRHGTLPEGVTAVELYRFVPNRPSPAQARDYLTDAWSMCTVVDCGGLPPQRLASVLQGITTDLLITGKPVDRGIISDAIELLRIEAAL